MTPDRPATSIVLLLLCAFLVSADAVFGDSERTSLGRRGYVVIEGGRDTTAGFRWQEGPAPGRHSLVWPEGTLSLPDSLTLDDFGQLDAGLACAEDLSGVGASGHLVFRDGSYQISEPVLLADGVLELHISAGELIVRGDQIRYRRPQVTETKTQANYVFLAGLVVLIVVLMRRARHHLGQS